jgi:predicted ABC-type transport system involved in lysophospholipase L1 biosynthesis ATPase subunit
MRIDRSYTLAVDVSGADVAEAFGVESGHVVHIASGLEIPTDYSILYITGESGSGKTTLLQEVGPVTEIIIPALPLYAWGPTVSETLAVLSLVGLADATLFVARYEHLSDSQKARARLALAIIDGHRHIIVDEFLSTLDRETAKAVAFTFGKALRRMGLRATLATAHDDLAPYLRPDVVVRGRAFPSRFTVEATEWPDTNPITASLTLAYVDKDFYRSLRLGELHYKGKYTGGTKEYLAAFLGTDCIGILVSVYRMHDGGRRIARVVVHPSYRGCGVGVALVRRYVRDHPGTDVVAVMAAYNPVFERAGMSRTTDSHVPAPKGLLAAMRGVGMDASRWHERAYCTSLMASEDARRALADFASHATNLVCPGGKRPPVDEIAKHIANDQATAGRVLWGLRERRLAKFVHKENP